jgi:probable rRNA maturation factor
MAPRVGAQVGDASARLRVPGGRRRLCREVRAVVVDTLAETGVATAEISVTLLDDAAIAALNEAHLGHRGPTDVLSFPLYVDGEPVVGDVYVGLEQAVRQAQSLQIPMDEEVIRLAVHGTLHVLGMDHPVGAGRTSSAMWRLQEQIVSRWRRRT